MTAARFLPWLLKHWGPPFTEVEWNAARKSTLPEEPVGLYCHIPFCRQLCSFCPYCKALYEETTANAYITALIQEIDLVAQQYGLDRQKKEVTDLYFGGGTPALLAGQLGMVIHHLRQYFAIRGGIAIELHPDDLTEVTLEALVQAGITMISVGVQSFDATVLQNLGRSADDMAQRMALVRACSFQVIDMDLIFGIAGQTVASLRQDMFQARMLGATQISTYPLIRFSYTHATSLPASPRQQRQLLDVLADCARELGLERTSVWTFAQPDSIPYTSVTRPAFIGFGVSALSQTGPHLRINPFSVKEYCLNLQKRQLPQQRCLAFNSRQHGLYVLFWQAFRLHLDKSDFQKRTGQEMDRCLPDLLLLARLLGWIRRKQDGSGYQLTRRGIRLYHEVEQQVTHQLLDPVWRQSTLQGKL
jgi:oxygen-independent coproporphyrinogen-3 oxidase